MPLHLALPNTQKKNPTQDSQRRLAIAQNLLLSPFDLSLQSAQKALAAIAVKGVHDADLYFEYTRAQSFGLEEGIVKTGSFSIDQGVGVRAVSGEKTAFAYSDNISMASLLTAADAVKSIANAGQNKRIKTNTQKKQLFADKINTKSLKSKEIDASNTALLPMRELYGSDDPIESLSSAEKVLLLERVEKLARARDPRVRQVMASVACEWDVVLIMRMNGSLATDVRPLVRLSVTVIAEQKGRREIGSSGGGARVNLQYFDDKTLAHYVNQAVDNALINLQAQAAPAGEMSVVLGNGWPGILLHEAVGHGLEGDFNRKGSSAFSGRIGQRVAAKGVTILDDGTLKGRRGSLNIDDEGNLSQCTTLIEDGILKGYLQDNLNARLMNGQPTGNSRRESYASIPIPRMTNTYMLAGNKTHDEIIASVKRGIYASNFSGGQVDITSGKFVFSASQAYWIENGKIQYPITGATLIGAGPQSLQQVSMIGNNLELDSGVGTCGKEGQSVPVGVGQPTLRIDGLTVGGTA